ncbi:MAG: hypothetical protein K5906_03150 [Bacilli bacterium]|nr:hypothetical protein [Bacilli bacterium]
MKKLFIPILGVVAFTSLVGCSNSTKYDGLNIVSPSGAPALALYDVYDNKNIEINGDATAVAAYMSNDSAKDIIIAPTNLVASKVMKANAPFKLAAVITFGNFYLASTGLDDNDAFDKDDYIVLFQQNSLPDKLFKFVYGDDFTNIHYVSSAKDASVCLQSGKNDADKGTSVDYVLVPQPALTPALKKAKENRSDVADKIKVIKNIQSDYASKTDNAPLTQASIFVKNTTEESKINKINAFLADINTKINNILKDQSDLDAKLGGLENTDLANLFGAPNLTILKSVVASNSIGIGYQNAKDYKDNIDKFLINLGFNNEATSESLYW